MDRLRCLVLILVLGGCYCALEDSHLSDSVVEGLDVKLSAFDGRAARPVQYKRKGYKNVTRIVGGMPITEPIPYQISLQVLAYTNWRHICGGSIIGKSHVLTAAHCMDRLRADRLSIVAGTNNLKSGGVRHRVANYTIHPMYSNKGYLINDLAIIKVTTPFQFNQKVASINLADSTGSVVENNYPVTLTGWGSTSQINHSKTPDQLMILNYNTIPNTSCRSRGYKVTPNEICTYMAKFKGACVGDSGGPLTNRERNIQIGVVSYGSTTCASGLPDVFTRVANFRQWMRKVVLTEIP